jgi:Undecaprenyl-phosphate glucose phosphotransferase
MQEQLPMRAEPSFEFPGSSQPSARAEGKFYSTAILPGTMKMVDLAIILLVGVVAYVGYHYSILSLDPDPQHQAMYIVALVIAAVIWMNLAVQQKFYSLEAMHDLSSQCRKILICWTVTVALLLAVAFLIKISQNFSRAWLFSWYTGVLIALILSRAMLLRLMRQWSAEGQLCLNVAVVGDTPEAAHLVKYLQSSSEVQNVRIVGIFDDGSALRSGPRADGMSVGSFAQLDQQCRSGLIDTVFLAIPWSFADRIRTTASYLKRYPVDVRLCPDNILFELSDYTISQLGKLPIIHLADRPLKDWRALIKFAEDRLLGAAALLFISPVMLLCALAVRLDSGGPVLFRQKRFGFNNQEFEALKFRTMYVDRMDSSGAQRTIRNDPRVTRVGAVLRRLSLDELPQLINVMRGEMSIVGPRAHAVHMKVGDRYYFDAFQDYAARHRVKPGITGWAQINGLRGEVDTVDKAQRRLEFDLYYVNNWSLWLDVKIIVITAFKTLFSKEAY